MKEVHFFVNGRVQGVGYRAWCVRTASKFGISGWVRNRFDGTVEILAIGQEFQIDGFLKECLKGPLWANVKSLKPVQVPTAILPIVKEGIFCQQPTV